MKYKIARADARRYSTIDSKADYHVVLCKYAKPPFEHLASEIYTVRIEGAYQDKLGPIVETWSKGYQVY